MSINTAVKRAFFDRLAEITGCPGRTERQAG